ncbi:Protein translocase subunit SecA [Bienertia sinuspersici]
MERQQPPPPPHHCSHWHQHHHHHLVFHHPHHHHHHHHHVIVPKCAFHNNFPQNPTSNSNLCTHLITPFPQIPKPPSSLTSHINPNIGSSDFQPPQDTQNFQDDGIVEYEEDDDEDPIFVMTDEWREFFAKSEAKRREAKKLAKKQRKT